MKGDYFPIFRDDVAQWESDGVTSDEIEAIVIALFRWWRGHTYCDKSALSVAGRVLYSSTVARWKCQAEKAAVRSAVGKLAAAARWDCDKGNAKCNAKGNAKCNAMGDAKSDAKKCPTTTTTTTTTTITTRGVVGSAEGNGDAPAITKPTAPRFKAPTVQEVRAYCAESGNGINAENFVDYYAANGWRVGKSPMRDWKAAVRCWARRDADADGAGAEERERARRAAKDAKVEALARKLVAEREAPTVADAASREELPLAVGGKMSW